jgi:hypothetical protein
VAARRPLANPKKFLERFHIFMILSRKIKHYLLNIEASMTRREERVIVAQHPRYLIKKPAAEGNGKNLMFSQRNNPYCDLLEILLLR